MDGVTGSAGSDAMFCLRAFVTLAFLSGLVSACVGRPAGSEQEHSGAALTQDSGEVIIRLDQDWLAQAWEGEAPQQASLVLLGAHPADEEAFAPCAPPPRIALRYLDRDGAARERLLSCVNYCGPSLSDGLWGRLTRLVGVDAQTLPDRRIELVLRFRKLGFDPETGSNQNAQGETVYGSEIRTRPRSFYGPFGPAEGSTAGSCTELY